MELVADGVRRFAVNGKYMVNTYLVGDVIVDAGTPNGPKKLLPALEGHPVKTHALTHAHLDHVGGSRELSETLGLPVWASEGDAPAIEEGRAVTTNALVKRFAGNFEAVPVARRLKEGDELTEGFVVVETPGHSPGHISFWRESDRVLIAGDVFVNRNMLTGRVRLGHPPGAFTVDAEENKRSERKLAELEPDVVVFGHGPVLRDAAPKLRAFVG